MNSKPVWKSKILWANLITIAVLLAQSEFGYVISPEAQGGILAAINILLRLITKEPLDWGGTGTDNSDNDGSGTPVSQAGFARVYTLFFVFVIALAMLATLSGCATTNPATPTEKDSPVILAGKSLLAVKSTITTSATAVNALCEAQKLAVDKCIQARDAYNLSKPAYDSAVDAYLLMVQGGDPAEFGRSLQRVQSIATTLLTLTGGAK